MGGGTGAGTSRVAVTGLGAVTSLGSGAERFFDALLEGRHGLREVTLFPRERFRASLAAEADAAGGFGEGPERDRAYRLALAAACEAVGGSGASLAGPRCALSVGTTLGGNRLYTAWLAAAGGAPPPSGDEMGSAARLLAERFGVTGRCATLSVACASGTAALGLAFLLIRRGEAERVLCGGFDALSDFVFSGFDALRALSPGRARPFDARRDGLVLGEGAGFLVLEAEAAARARGAAVRAWVRGYGSAADAHHMTRPSPSGEGLVRAVRAALEDAGIAPSDVSAISAHGTATVFNDRMEANAFGTVFGEGSRRVPVDSIKGAIGHTLGAAGALEAVMSVQALERRLLPPTAGFEEPDPSCPLDVVAGPPRPLPEEARFLLSTSSAFAGTNAALVLERA